MTATVQANVFPALDIGAASAESRNLDLLRAVAVASVFAAHLIQTLMSVAGKTIGDNSIPDVLLGVLGYAGVLLFFVHTSLVLLLSMERMNGGNITVRFYIRRFFRIYPLSTACILTVFSLSVPVTPFQQYNSFSLGDLLSNIFLIQNITNSPYASSPLWSLPLEVQMYIVLPFVYLLLTKFRSFVFVLIMWVTAFIVAPSSMLLKYYPCFMAGAIAYQARKRFAVKIPAGYWPITLCAWLCYYALAAILTARDVRVDHVLCLILGLAIPATGEMNVGKLSIVSHVVAKYSYGIYLCHLPIIWLMFVKLSALHPAIRWPAFVGLMGAVPWVAYHLLEAPLIRTGRRLSDACWLRGLNPAAQSPIIP